MAKNIDIKNRTINKSGNAFIIAEIGLNHNNDWDLTKKMINSAKESGADAVKFQFFDTDKLMLPSEGAYSIFKGLELSKDFIKQCKNYADEIGIIFFASTFDRTSGDFLDSLNVPCYKIASMDLNNYRFIEHLAKKRKPIIISTGMSSIGEIEKAVHTIEKVGNTQIIIMHCISKYPPKYEDMNIKMIEKLQLLFPDYLIGLSDHTMDNTISIVARTLGASVFERHFTLSRDLEGPDHGISVIPEELKQLRSSLDAVDMSLKESNSVREDFHIAHAARRSLFASCDIAEGTVLTESMIKIVRPGTGIAPEFLPLFIGRKVTKGIKENHPIDMSVF